MRQPDNLPPGVTNADVGRQQEPYEDDETVCPLCWCQSEDGRVHQECADRETCAADAGSKTEDEPCG